MNSNDRQPPDSGAPMHAAAPSPDAVREILRQIIDPEVGVNIVDLGLVYRIESTPESLRVAMTMTSPACPLGAMIVDDVSAALVAGLPGRPAPEVTLVWEPPWQPSMISEHGKLALGWSQP